MEIYIDGDACPVKDIVIEEAQKNQMKVKIITSFSHYSNNVTPNNVEVIYVDDGFDAADYRIVGLIQKADILITQDYGLASLALNKQCRVLHHLGFEYTNENIQRMLHSRHVSAVMRKSGQKTKGPKKLTREDKRTFQKSLEKIMQES